MDNPVLAHIDFIEREHIFWRCIRDSVVSTEFPFDGLGRCKEVGNLKDEHESPLRPGFGG